MKANIPIPELPDHEEVQLMLTVTAVRRRLTQQGQPFYDARGYNATGSLPLRVWSETIEASGDLTPGLWQVTGIARDRQFVLTGYQPASLETYLEQHGHQPVLPCAYTLDIETLALPGYRERAVRKLERRRRLGEMSYDQQQRYQADQVAEEERAYRQGSLSATSGRVLSIATHIAPQHEFVRYAASTDREHVFGIDSDGREEGEEAALRAFVGLMETFNPDIDEIVGHNVAGFDLPFIYQRCLANGIAARPTVEFTGYNVFDTMRYWGMGDRRNAGLDDIAWALGIESSKTADVDGSRVHELYHDGRLAEISEYNLRDVRVTRRIYDRMISILGR